MHGQKINVFRKHVNRGGEGSLARIWIVRGRPVATALFLTPGLGIVVTMKLYFPCHAQEELSEAFLPFEKYDQLVILMFLFPFPRAVGFS
jgi:hypothetical protein